MQPQLCSRCKKNVAVVFITRMENGKNINEGLCLKCAKNLGLPQVNEMMQRMGITDEDLDNISNEMMSAFGGAENLEGIDAPTATTRRTARPRPSRSSAAFSAGRTATRPRLRTARRTARAAPSAARRTTRPLSINFLTAIASTSPSAPATASSTR